MPTRPARNNGSMSSAATPDGFGTAPVFVSLTRNESAWTPCGLLNAALPLEVKNCPLLFQRKKPKYRNAWTPLPSNA
jgi:hypothetical protein